LDRRLHAQIDPAAYAAYVRRLERSAADEARRAGVVPDADADAATTATATLAPAHHAAAQVTIVRGGRSCATRPKSQPV
jgi:hypothetical protein